MFPECLADRRGRVHAALAVSLVTLSLACGLAGCGGSSKPITVSVTASATSVDGGDSVTLTASVQNDKNAAGVTWSVSGGGTLSNETTSSATYTAPSATSSALTVTVTATSVANNAKTFPITLTVPAKPAITGSGLLGGSLTSGAVGAVYSEPLTASGGIPPYTWTLVTGTLPACLSITQSSGTAALSGTPNASCAGTYNNLSFKVADSGTPTPLSATTPALTLTIAAAPPIVLPVSGTLPAGVYNVAYAASVAGTGGAGALTYALTGTLPAGVSLITGTGAITGTPTATGTFSFTIKAADAYGDSQSAPYSMTVSYPPIKVNSVTLPTGYVGSVYPQSTLTATGGSGTGYTWAMMSGSSLPAGLSLSAAGTITGKPTGTPGTTNFSVVVTDSASNIGTGALSITIDAGVSITTATTLPFGYVGSSYSQQLAATGGTGTGYSWAVTTGSTLPAGLTLSTAGLLSGKPTLTGSATFNITVTDSAGNTGAATFSMTIKAGVSINTITLPAGYPGTAYLQTTLTATGGTGTGYTWSWIAATGSTLPTGLSLSSGGVISGTPSNTSSSSVVSNVVVTATDSAGNSGSANFAVTIEAQVAITTSTLPSGAVNTAYPSTTLVANGGTNTFTWAWVATGGSSLPGGLNLSTAGVITGTPTTQGSYNITITATDSAGHAASTNFTITINASLSITTTSTSLPAAYTGTLYSQQLAATGGSGTDTWSVVSGTSNLSTFNLNLSTSGLLSGTPASTGTASFTAQVKDSSGDTATAPLSIPVYNPVTLPAPSSSVPGPATVNQSYSGSISVSGGLGPYTWSIGGTTVTAAGLALTDGLTAYSSGGSSMTISGTPTSTGSVTLTSVQVTDSLGNKSSAATYTIAINTAGSSVSGQISLYTQCGTVSALPTFTVSINTTPAQTVTTDSSGNYSLTNVQNGTYTITPSISGVSAVFYPAALSVVVSSSAVSSENFAAAVAYSVSGNVSYSGTQSGQVYLLLTGCGTDSYGTSITKAALSSGGAFTIHGVAPGSYTLQAWMDNLGYGMPNTANPTGTSASLTLGTADIIDADVTLTDPALTAPTTVPTLKQVFPTDQGVAISFGVIWNSTTTEEAVSSYTIQWSTDSTFATSVNSHTFAAIALEGSHIWILNNGLPNNAGTFTNGSTYYFRVRGANSAGSGPWTYWGTSTTPTGVKIGTPSGTYTVTGTITIPSGITPTGPLYVVLSDEYAHNVDVARIASPSASNSFSIQVPDASTYSFYAVLDQNNDGLMDGGDVVNNTTVTVSGNLSGQNMTLPVSNSTVGVQTGYTQSTYLSGSSSITSTTYSLSFTLLAGNEQPVSAELASASDPNLIVPVDFYYCGTACEIPELYYSAYIDNSAPKVGDTFTFNVVYSDGQQETLTGAVTGVISNASASNLSPTGDTTNPEPAFSWTYPANAGNYSYDFYLINQSTGYEVWQIPSATSNAISFTSAQIPGASITFPTDPTNSTNTPTQVPLTAGTYLWWIGVADANGNGATTLTYFTLAP